MGKQKLFVKIILFFLILYFFVPTGQIVYAKNLNVIYNFQIFCNEKSLNLKIDLNLNQRKNNIFEWQIKNLGISQLLKKLNEFNLSDKERVLYVFPEIKELEQKTRQTIEKNGKKPNIYVVKNTCKIQVENAVPYEFLNEEKFYLDILKQIESGKKNIVIYAETVKEKAQNLKNKFTTKSSFETQFVSSSEERKNNIRVALSKFDGLVLEAGETFSFNGVTGKRTAESGYAQAKIISGGTFVQGFGGGVCQVSTTIYNACLLAGLEILEVHQHSLPVSYVEAGFDAMVNFSSSDLVVRNNTDSTIILTTSSKNDKCKVKIFGSPNDYTIVRVSKKTKVIPKSEEFVDCDYSKYQNLDLEVGEQKRLSHAKDGCQTESYLCFYDSNGALVKQTKIRENTYNPTIGLVVVRKN